MRGDHPCKTALATAAHEVGHRAQRGAARLVAHFTGNGGREDLRLVNDHDRRIPVIARCIEQGRQKGRRTPHLRFELEAFETEDDGSAMLANAFGHAGDLRHAIVAGLDRHVAEFVAERDEVPFRIDHDLLDEPGTAFQQPPKEVRLARSAIPLDEQASREELLEVHPRRSSPFPQSNVDADAHEALLDETGRRRQAVAGLGLAPRRLHPSPEADPIKSDFKSRGITWRLQSP